MSIVTVTKVSAISAKKFVDEVKIVFTGMCAVALPYATKYKTW